MSKTTNAPGIREFVANRLPVVLYCLVGLAWLVQGLRYVSADMLMRYHLAVLDTPWESLDPNEQTIFLGLLKAFGAGSIGVGLAIILLALVPLREGRSWSRWATPALAALYTGMLVYVTNVTLLAGAVPITATGVLFGTVVVASACSILGVRKPT